MMHAEWKTEGAGELLLKLYLLPLRRLLLLPIIIIIIIYDYYYNYLTATIIPTFLWGWPEVAWPKSFMNWLARHDV